MVNDLNGIEDKYVGEKLNKKDVENFNKNGDEI